MKRSNAAKRQGKSKVRKVIERKGFYIALFACAVLIGFASFFNRQISKTKSSFDDDAWRSAVANSGIEEIQPAAAPAASAEPKKATPPSAAPAPTEEPSVAASASDEPPKLDNPLAGGIIKEYSEDDLIYSETMKDWRTHSGLDIAADVGTQVKAAADGVVEQVYEDDLLGVVVVIGHSGQTQTLYANLQSLDFIKVGRQVKTGDIIGGVGTSAIAEASDEPHLHFEVLVNKENADPKKLLQM